MLPWCPRPRCGSPWARPGAAQRSGSGPLTAQALQSFPCALTPGVETKKRWPALGEVATPFHRSPGVALGGRTSEDRSSLIPNTSSPRRRLRALFFKIDIAFHFPTVKPACFKPDLSRRPALQPGLFMRHRSEAFISVAKRAVGADLECRHTCQSVERQIRETSVADRIAAAQ